MLVKLQSAPFFSDFKYSFKRILEYKIPSFMSPNSTMESLSKKFSFSSSGYLDVSVHRVPSVHLWIQCTVTEVCSAGFPHSEIYGSMDMCSSP